MVRRPPRSARELSMFECHPLLTRPAQLSIQCADLLIKDKPHRKSDASWWTPKAHPDSWLPPAAEIIDCILLTCGTIPNFCLEITFNFKLKLLSAFVSSTTDFSKALSCSWVLSFSSLSLTFCFFHLVANSCWTLFRALLLLLYSQS